MSDLRTCLALLLSSGCAEAELGVVIDGERLPVIDMHLHPGDWDAIPPATQEFLASRFPWPVSLRPEKAAADVLSPAGILDEMDRAGVSVGVLFAIYAPRTVGIAANADVAADVASAPKRFLGLASLRVDRWESDGPRELAGPPGPGGDGPDGGDLRGGGAAGAGGGEGAGGDHRPVGGDPRPAFSLSPVDREAVFASVRKTSRVLVAYEDSLSWGYGAEIAARIADEAFEWLDAPVRRLAATDTFVAYAPELEDVILPQVAHLRQAMAELAAF